MRSLHKLFLFSAILLVLAGCNGCSNGGGIVGIANTNNHGTGSGVATLSWTPPKMDTLGNPLTELAGFKIYYKRGSEPKFSQVIDVGNVTTYTFKNLQTGVVFYFAVTAYDFSGNESGYSSEMSKSL